MQKTIILLSLGISFAAFIAGAQDDVAWWKKPFVKSDSNAEVSAPAPEPELEVQSREEINPPMHQQRKQRPMEQRMMPGRPDPRNLPPEQRMMPGRPDPRNLSPEQQQRMMHGRPDQQRNVPPAQMDKLKEHHDEVMKLGEAARNETDPVQKEEFISQLRAKLNDVADRMEAMHRKRLETAERDLKQLKKAADDNARTREQRIEDQLQRILSGEPPIAPARKMMNQNQERRMPSPKSAE